MCLSLSGLSIEGLRCEEVAWLLQGLKRWLCLQERRGGWCSRMSWLWIENEILWFPIVCSGPWGPAEFFFIVRLGAGFVHGLFEALRTLVHQEL